MARSTDQKHRAAAMSGAALAAAMLGSAGVAAPAPAPAQQEAQPAATASGDRAANWQKVPGQARIHIKYRSEFKHKGEYAIAGVTGGRVVFEDERGKLFYVDETTGDQKFVTRKVFSKVELDRVAKAHHWIKLGSKVSILGVEDGGKLIMADNKGEKFYLDAVTGDMIFIK